jgi:hypothetical protein
LGTAAAVEHKRFRGGAGESAPGSPTWTRRVSATVEIEAIRREVVVVVDAVAAQSLDACDVGPAVVVFAVELDVSVVVDAVVAERLDTSGVGEAIFVIAVIPVVEVVVDVVVA